MTELVWYVWQADEFTRANVGNKLSVIVDQIKYLQEQARKVRVYFVSCGGIVLYARKSNFSALLPWPERDRRWALSAGGHNLVLVTAVAVAWPKLG